MGCGEYLTQLLIALEQKSEHEIRVSVANSRMSGPQPCSRPSDADSAGGGDDD